MKEVDYNIENILNGVNKLAKAVLTTMGPNGSTMILIDDFGRARATKDGVSVANEVFFENPVENGAADLVKQVAKQTVEEAGDGTTTSICLAQAFINKGFELLESGYSINQVQELLDNVIDLAIDYLEKVTVQLDRKNIKHVAKISANNDEKIANIITEAYEHSDIVKVEETTNKETTIEKIDGIKLNTSYFDPAFINNMSKQSVEYNNSMSLLLVDGNLNNPENLKQILTKLNSAVVIADYFSKAALQVFKDSYNRGGIDIVLIKSPGVAGHRRNIMKDLSKYFNIELIDPNKRIGITEDISKYIGSVDSVLVTKTKTVLYNKDANFKEYLNDLKNAFENEEDKDSKKLLEQRIENLSGSMSIIKVGGSSDLEIKEKKDRIDDAVLAVKCALEEGIIKGGGLTLVDFANQYEYKAGINDFINCFYEPAKTIFNMDRIVNSITNINDEVIDPVKVTKTALKNAVSVSKVLLSAKGAVLSPRLWS